MDHNPYSAPNANVDDALLIAANQPPFFAVSLRKLTVMWLCTFGVYHYYWFYKNWVLIKKRESSDIMPAARAFFSVFYCYPCFANISNFRLAGENRPTMHAGGLAAIWIIAYLFRRLPGPYALIVLMIIPCMLVVQRRANAINIETLPRHDPNNRFSPLNWIVIVLGGVFWILAIIGLTLPEE
jgi:hypothetical protein